MAQIFNQYDSPPAERTPPHFVSEDICWRLARGPAIRLNQYDPVALRVRIAQKFGQIHRARNQEQGLLGCLSEERKMTA